MRLSSRRVAAVSSRGLGTAASNREQRGFTSVGSRVAVPVERHRRAGVPDPVLDDLDVGPVGDEQADVGVA